MLYAREFCQTTFLCTDSLLLLIHLLNAFNLWYLMFSCPLFDRNYCVVCVRSQENHMRSVMMCVLEGGGGAAAEGEEQLVERSAEQAKLGVNLLLFAGSR